MVFLARNSTKQDHEYILIRYIWIILPCASRAETSISEQKYGKTAYHMDFMRFSKTPQGTIHKTTRTLGRGDVPRVYYGKRVCLSETSG